MVVNVFLEIIMRKERENSQRCPRVQLYAWQKSIDLIALPRLIICFYLPIVVIVSVNWSREIGRTATNP